ncbi:MAG TPA: phosphatidylserine decarboxylase family protein [Saprospiraceae bacterium]|nr:phosphatidylserine decarboxylase family protein [Saprospiraceae bacterium]HPN70399.1 phosphatidylserine decarboxylase family protein [Saprospiraceae bacterium]
MIHKEGKKPLLSTIIVFTILSLIFQRFLPAVFPYLAVLLLVMFLVYLNFFKNPNREIKQIEEDIILAPADGKVVVIERVIETEFLQKEVTQVSIFMNPLNVHVNRNPVSGVIKYFKYHPGKFMPAWEPKSSTENERTTTVYENKNGLLLMRQIAGALAKRIVWYIKEGDEVNQGADMGFIKLGSRVDLFIPDNFEILVGLDQKSIGNRTVIAKLK